MPDEATPPPLTPEAEAVGQDPTLVTPQPEDIHEGVVAVDFGDE